MGDQVSQLTPVFQYYVDRPFVFIGVVPAAGDRDARPRLGRDLPGGRHARPPPRAAALPGPTTLVGAVLVAVAALLNGIGEADRDQRFPGRRADGRGGPRRQRAAAACDRVPDRPAGAARARRRHAARLAQRHAGRPHALPRRAGHDFRRPERSSCSSCSACSCRRSGCSRSASSSWNFGRQGAPGVAHRPGRTVAESARSRRSARRARSTRSGAAPGGRPRAGRGRAPAPRPRRSASASAAARAASAGGVLVLVRCAEQRVDGDEHPEPPGERPLWADPVARAPVQLIARQAQLEGDRDRS